MSVQDLGLPPRFEEVMKRRLGATRIFVEVNGKYYLDEARLHQVEQRRAGRMDATGARVANRTNMLTLRIARMVVGVTAVILFLANFLVLRTAYVSYIVLVLVDPLDSADAIPDLLSIEAQKELEVYRG